MHEFEEFGDLEKRGWSDPEVAQSYAAGFAEASLMCVPATVSAVGAQNGTRALDLCTGHGIVAEGLLATGAEVTALDFSAAMLEMARARAPDARFVEGDAMNLPFDAESFDAVTSGFGVPHLPDPSKTFAEARRVLSRGGRFAYSVWSGSDVAGAFGWVFQAIAKHGDSSITLPPGPDATVYGTRDVAVPSLEAEGFGEIKIETVASFWPTVNAAAPYEFFHDGTVRGGALLRPQPQANKNAIRQAVVEEVTRHCGSGPDFRIPMPAVIVSAIAI